MDDDFGDWQEKAQGGKKCPFAVAQLAQLLERYVAFVIASGLLTDNYTAAADDDVDKLDLSKVVKAETTLLKGLDNYHEGLSNGVPVKIMLALTTPEWAKPGGAASLTIPRRNRDPDDRHESSPKRAKSQSTRFSVDDRAPPGGGRFTFGGNAPPGGGRFSGFSGRHQGGQSRNSYSSAEVDNRSSRFGTFVRIGRYNGSVLPPALRPSNVTEEGYLIVGEPGGHTPNRLRQSWDLISQQHRELMIQFVAANTDKVKFNRQNEMVYASIGQSHYRLFAVPGQRG